MSPVYLVLLVSLGHQALATQENDVHLQMRQFTPPEETTIEAWTNSSTPTEPWTNSSTTIDPWTNSSTTMDPWTNSSITTDPWTNSSTTTEPSTDSPTTREPYEGCGGEYNSSTGIIRHPLEGSRYENNQNCLWIIRASVPITITFKRFDTEAYYDFLEIRSGPFTLGPFSGSTVPSSIHTNGEVQYLEFTSDLSYSERGFVLHWKPSVMDCPEGYVEIGDQCMKMFNEKMSWGLAKKCCEMNSAQLVSLNSDPMALRDYVMQYFPTSTFWVGAKNYNYPVGWQWVSGAPINTNFPWAINDDGVQQPDLHSRNCMLLRYYPFQDDQGYADRRCFKKNAFICEKRKILN